MEAGDHVDLESLFLAVGTREEKTMRKNKGIDGGGGGERIGLPSACLSPEVLCAVLLRETL